MIESVILLRVNDVIMHFGSRLKFLGSVLEEYDRGFGGLYYNSQNCWLLLLFFLLKLSSISSKFKYSTNIAR